MLWFGFAASLAFDSCSIPGAYVRQGDAKISVTVPAMVASRALKQVGQAAHLELTTTPQTENDILVIRFTDVPVSEAMKRIAEADNGTWKQEGNSFRLIRTSAQARAEEDKEFKMAVERIEKSIRKKADALKTMSQWSQEQADQLAKRVESIVKSFNPAARDGNWYKLANGLSEQAPVGRVVTQIATLMDPKELATLPPHYKIVWSTRPTATQRPLPSGVLPVIEQFAQDQALWGEAIEKHHLTAPTVGGVTYWVGGFGDFRDTAVGKVSTVLLTGQLYANGAVINLNLTAYDEKGKKIAGAEAQLGNDFDAVEEIMNDKAPAPAGEETIVVNGDAKVLVEAMRRAGPSGKSQLPEQLVQKLVHPEEFDPLSLFLSDQLQQVAKIKSVNLVAHLNDDMFLAGVVGSFKAAPVSKYLGRLKDLGCEYELNDGWLIAQPQHPNQGRLTQADRGELGKYLRRVILPRALSIDEQATFAVSLPDEETNAVPKMLSSLVKEDTSDSYYDRNVLRFYGLLTPDQKSKMQAGGMPCNSLTEEQMECVNRMVYSGNSFLQFAPSVRGTMIQEEMDLHNNGILREATESLPNGIPPQGLIKLRIDNSYVVITGDKQNGSYRQTGRAFDASSLAWQKYSQDHPDLFPWMSEESQRLDLSRFKYGKRMQLNFSFQFTDSLSVNQSLEDKSMGDFIDVAFDGLPDEFKKQFQTAYENDAKAYANVKPGDLGAPNRNTNPPPSPN